MFHISDERNKSLENFIIGQERVLQEFLFNVSRQMQAKPQGCGYPQNLSEVVDMVHLTLQDLNRAVDSFSRMPNNCSGFSHSWNVDLFEYKQGRVANNATQWRCFQL